jgi:hypothetical protein
VGWLFFGKVECADGVQEFESSRFTSSRVHKFTGSKLRLRSRPRSKRYVIPTKEESPETEVKVKGEVEVKM